MPEITSSSAEPDLTGLLDLLHGRRVVVLSGAGCSTESGIPDYRGPEGRLRARKPIQYGDFVRSPAARARYWSRSAVGWPAMSSAKPNSGHEALARLEEAGRVGGIITQNVDGLHQAAGSRRVVELHGSLAKVRCLECGAVTSREALQPRLVASSPGRVGRREGRRGGEGFRIAPDGDADVSNEALEEVQVPDCEACGGVLKPDVVFFGENVPADTVARAWSLFEGVEALLVVGSSLTVYSGRRFVLRAARDGVPIGIVTLGPTRVDELASVKLEAHLGEALPRLAGALLDA